MQQRSSKDNDDPEAGKGRGTQRNAERDLASRPRNVHNKPRTENIVPINTACQKHLTNAVHGSLHKQGVL